tara:strand:- start:218 stop:442 length:225 start_codon:yes stop_codon:yes gene_type:complete
MKRIFTDREKGNICLDYITPVTHLTLAELARKYDCSIGTIYNILEEYNISRRGRGKDLAQRQARSGFASSSKNA